VEPLWSHLTSVRRAVGVAVVFFLLGAAVAVYREGPSVSSSGSSREATLVNSSPHATPLEVGTPSATTGGMSSTAAPPRASVPTPPATTTLGAGDSTDSGSGQMHTIQVETPTAPAKPFQTVAIRGRYHGGANAFLRVQRWERVRWRAFPLPTRTDPSGQFTAYVEFGQPGLYWLRVLDSGSRVKSKPFLLVIKH
jgi:hypothetical protein